MSSLISVNGENYDLDKYNNFEIAVLSLLKKIEENTRK